MRPTIGIGMIGTGWMAKAHMSALRRLPVMADLPFDLSFVALAGRDPARTEHTGTAWGFARTTTQWQSIVDDPEVDILVNLAGNDAHAAPSIAALRLGKHVLCEKPIATDLDEVTAMVAAASASSAISVVGYNYRFVPALQLVRRLLEEGQLGALRAVNVSYEQDWAASAVSRTGWRFEDAGGGSTVFDLSHILDLLCWLVDTPVEVIAEMSTLVADGTVRPVQSGDPEDTCVALARMPGGITATVRMSRIATGRKGAQRVELIGSLGRVEWDMESLNTLVVDISGGDPLTDGPRSVLVTEPQHPCQRHWYAPGHIIGWDDTVLHQWISVMSAITGSPTEVPTDVADFAQGARAVRVADALRRSASSRQWTACD